MVNSKNALQQRLRQAFRDEAAERLQALADALAVIEQSPDEEAALIEAVFREVHSLKGAARAVSLTDIERLCQHWESLLSALKQRQLPPIAEHWSLSRQARRHLQQLIDDEEAVDREAVAVLCQAFELAIQAVPNGSRRQPPATGEGRSDSPTVLPTVLPTGGATSGATDTRLPDAVAPGQLKVSAQRLDSLLFLNEELQQIKLNALEHALADDAAAKEIRVWRRDRHELGAAARQLKGRLANVNDAVQNQLQTLLDFIDWSGDFLSQWEYRLLQTAARSDRYARDLVSLTDRMHQELQHILVLPCSVLTDGLPAMVQDIAEACGKEVRLDTAGIKLQADKRVLDELRSPLQHLVRNAVDHGLETPRKRRERGKDATGKLSITFSQDVGDKFELRIQDDGRGMDIAALRQTALAQGLVSASEIATWDDEQLYRLAFSSGFSTSDMITDLSGRGLGLTIVQEKVERLGGQVMIESHPNEGTTFTLNLPTTLTTYRAVLVRATESVLAIPAQVVDRVLRLPVQDLRTIENRLSLSLDGQLLPLWRLADILALPGQPPLVAEQQVQAVILNVGEAPFALLVDEVIGDQEITLKSLGRQLKRVRNVLGATLLGDGRIVPLLHPQDLFKSACGTESAPLLQQLEQEARERKSRLLVVEDSVTSRGLLKTILESAGHEVTTATDGMAGWEQLKQSAFDLVVSDIEMPRLDGFALTERIRNDRNLRDLPIVLVTALQSPEDRERGLEVGANAYIVKSGFDQSNLLDVIRRLI